MALGVVPAATGTVGWRGYRYVTARASPYVEVGIEVNRYLPGPLRARALPGSWNAPRERRRPIAVSRGRYDLSSNSLASPFRLSEASRPIHNGRLLTGAARTPRSPSE